MADTNGDVKGRLKAARQRMRDSARLREAMRLERRAEVLESGVAAPTPFDYVNAYQVIMDRFRSEPWSYSVTSPYDKKFGRNFPIYQSEAELSLLRAPSRVLCQTNTYAQALLFGLRSYIIGPGYTYRATAKDNVDVPQGLPEAVQEVVDGFLKRNQWNQSAPWADLEQMPLRPIEGESFERSLRDGETGILHYFDPDSGETDARFFEPEFVQQPSGSRWEEWSFGIRTPLNDEQRKLAFWISFAGNVGDGEEYPVRDIAYMPRNSDRIAKRGVPDFSFDAYQALQTAQRLRSSLAIGGAQKAAIVGVRQHKATTQTQVSTFQQALADINQVNLVSGAIQPVRLFDPGTWEDIPEQLEYVAGPSTTNEDALVAVLAACLRGAVVRWNGFEWLVSADASSNSYANALAAESPAVRRVQDEQAGYKALFLRSCAIAVRNAADAGRVRVEAHTYSFAEIAKYVEIQVEAPSPIVREKDKEAQTDATLIDKGIKSIQTVCQEQGLDYEREMQNIEDHKERFPPEPPPGMARAGEEGEQPGMDDDSLFGSPVPESLEQALFEDLFTGEITTRNGAKRRYVQGKQVKQVKASKKKPEGKSPAPGISTAADEPEKKPGLLARIGGTVGRGARVALAKTKELWMKLPEKPRKIIIKTLHVIETGMRKGKELALQAAQERGLGKEHIQRVGRVLAITDQVLSLGSIPAIDYALHDAGLDQLTSLLGSKVGGNAIPIASLAYVAYSTARNPLATIRAAAKVLTGKNTAGVHAHESRLWESLDEHLLPGELIERFDAAGEEADWYEALLMVALDQAADPRKAMELADEAFASNRAQEEEAPVQESLPARVREEEARREPESREVATMPVAERPITGERYVRDERGLVSEKIYLRESGDAPFTGIDAHGHKWVAGKQVKIEAPGGFHDAPAPAVPPAATGDKKKLGKSNAGVQATGGGASSKSATPAEERKTARRQALAKIKAAPVPSAEAVTKAHEELERARRGEGRAGGDARGGSAAARRQQRRNLFQEFGGAERGYVVCHVTGARMHWTDDPKENPHGYPKFERGKIFVKCQGGGYQLTNLIPESFKANRSRNDTELRKENPCAR